MGSLTASAQSMWPDLSTAVEGGNGATDAAVIVAIEDYAIVGDIAGARQNGLDWYTYMTESREIPTNRVQLLVDNQGVKESIEEAVQNAKGVVGEDGTLWLIFIGHGAPGQNGEDGLLVGWDTQQIASSIYARGLSQEGLLADLQDGPQANTVAIIDACFSGQDSDDGTMLVSGLQPMIPTYALQTHDALVLSAGKSNEFAGPLPGLARPAFSYLMLGAMRGWADTDGDGVVTAQESIDYGNSVLSSLPLGRTQTPQIRGSQPDLELGPAVEDGPSLSAIRRALVEHRTAASITPSTVNGAAFQAEQERIQREAALAWVQVNALAQQGGETGRQALTTFIAQYDGVATVDGETVVIPAVAHAQQMLLQYDAPLSKADQVASVSSAVSSRAPSSPASLRGQLRTDGFYKCQIPFEVGFGATRASIVVASDRQGAVLFVPVSRAGLGLRYPSLRANAEAGDVKPLETSDEGLALRYPGLAQVQFESLSPDEALVQWEWLGINKLGGREPRGTVCSFEPR